MQRSQMCAIWLKVFIKATLNIAIESYLEIASSWIPLSAKAVTGWGCSKLSRYESQVTLDNSSFMTFFFCFLFSSVIKCSANEEYQARALTCEPTCTDREPKCDTYHEACVCRYNFVRMNGKCIPASSCGCMYQKLYMKVSFCRVDRFWEKHNILQNLHLFF